ncbi:Alkaline phosphatase-like protein [Glarea lozoyensis ATCC 20868]|uniref:Alkaline phosphatase-like protein n=1 Tax=Glarea lozoyensis (strain ATCC 20868 / MF5171) TaxID=1116229 RepID=S3DBS4_GLAL2|nr:Alkaline phosphatase-like protein [Glarea lozoyensis ATCC 20868]EPE29421.1 Alkaline phosphatase-like protein [Glarea lozoyensis ATCC 20868]
MPPPRDTSSAFLAPQNYDDDASSIHSERSDQDTDSEDDGLVGARSSADIRAHDRGLLIEEEERDKLLEDSRRRGRRGSAIAITGPLKKLFSKSYSELPMPEGQSEVGEKEAEKKHRRTRRRQRRAKRKGQLMADAQNGEDGQLMYEMEEGSMKEGSATGDSSETEGSDEIDRRGLRGLHDDKVQTHRKWRMWCFLHLLIAVGFSILVLVAWKLSMRRNGIKMNQKLISNGTALFAPTTILISLDGFRADFLNRGITPRLNSFIAEGVSPTYMNPSFPSVTFPNHYTLVTGLYPESHGIVGNTFWDVELQEEFFYTNPLAMLPKWWGGEPLWVTAENQGIRTAIHMWPGSEAHIMDVEPAFLDKFNPKEPLSNKVDRILELLDKPGEESEMAEVIDMRPQLIAAYVPNVDQDGHLYGPNSTEIRTTIAEVDSMLDSLFKALEARNLTKIANVVVVSDHGMATVSNFIQLEDIIDTSLIEHTDGWPLYGLRPKDSAHLQGIYDSLKAASSGNDNYEVYLRDKDMPERYHFSKNERIAPLWIIPKAGWAIVTKGEFNVVEAKEKNLVYHPRGLHGYDHEHPLMRAIFVARGPAFPHAPNSRVESFQNIEVYNIVCDSLGIDPKPNNGTLRLPLNTIGLHSPETTPAEPIDPQVPEPESVASPVQIFTQSAPPATSASEISSADPVIEISPIEASSAADPNVVPPTMVGVDTPEDANVDRPVVGDDSVVSEEEKNFWSWFTDEINKAKGWFSDIVGHGEVNENDEKKF